jgi:hypothetical protein
MEELIKENQDLKEEVARLTSELHKYTRPQKEYYETNKAEVIKKSNERLKKLAEDNPDKLKEYRRTAYLKQKEKKKTQELQNNDKGL